MTIDEFVVSREIDYSKNLISENDISIMEVAMDASIGKQLKKYITEYGYLGLGHIEFFGINNKRGLSSDMVKQTQYMHKYFIKTHGLIAFEDQGDGDYYLVDKNDIMYRFVSSSNEITCQNMMLFEYIMTRLSIIQE